MFSFNSKPDPKKTIRETERQTRRTQREMTKDTRELEKLEKQLESQIKQAAKEGKKDLVAVYAKQLVQVRKQHVRSVQLHAKVGSVATNAKLAYSSQKMAESVGETAKVMGKINSQMDPAKTAAMLNNV